MPAVNAKRVTFLIHMAAGVKRGMSAVSDRRLRAMAGSVPASSGDLPVIKQRPWSPSLQEAGCP